MGKYKYQTHTHTAACSRCGRLSPEDLARALYEGGYAGAVLTNHFYGGNSAIDRTLSWEGFVKAYEDDYIACRKAAKKYDVDIIFGVEEHLYGGLEILAYGIEPEVLYAHPELVERQGEDWLKMLHGVGALMIQAHPYREASYITMPGPLPVEWIDGIEIFNVGNKDNANELAAEFAAQHPEFILTAGSDAHTTERVCMSGISTDERIRNAAELAEVLKSGRYELIY